MRLTRWHLYIHYSVFFFFNDTATTEIYTLSLHDALPIHPWTRTVCRTIHHRWSPVSRSEEHTSELQSRVDLVCRLLLEKKKKKRCPTRRSKKKKNTINNLNNNDLT